MSRTERSRPWHTLVAVLVVVAAVGAACGGGSEDRVDDDPADEEELRDTTAITLETEGEPQRGGKIVYGVEAETDGWNPTANRWAISGNLIGAAVYDPLAAFDADSEIQPYLAESFEADDTFKDWTITLREGVTFHNGDELTADAVASIIDAHTKSALTGSTMTAVDTISVVDPLTVKVTMKTPWATFPTILTGQAGVVPHPSVYDGSDPDGSRRPIGTGPFELKEWQPDQRWVGTAYEGYWQEGLPYLDEIEFRPITDNQSRLDSVLTNDVQVAHTTEPSSIIEMRERAADGDVQIVEDDGEGEETLVLINQDKPPFDNLVACQALAYATDRNEYVETIAPGTVIADGPFSPNSRWYDPEVADTYPDFDLERARELVAQYEQETGGELAFTLGNTTSVTAREQTDVLKRMWEAAGMKVDTTSTEQSAFIGNAITGNYQVQAWRQFGEPDPDMGGHWWRSDSLLNFARNKDSEVDAALQAARETPEIGARAEQYAIVQQRFAEQLPYLWIHHTRWAIVATNDVRGMTNGPLPDGEPSLPLGSGYSGTHRVAYLSLVQ